jgi:four helix bundle protein
MNLQDLVIYKLSMAMAQKVWNIVIGLDSFAKYTLGKQWVNASDSIGLNISEGFGRYHFRDAKNFYYYSRGSLFESLAILEKAHDRKLLSETDYKELLSELKDLGIKLNNFIRNIGIKPNSYAGTNDHRMTTE